MVYIGSDSRVVDSWRAHSSISTRLIDDSPRQAMADHILKCLNLDRDADPRASVGLDRAGSARLREQLVEEISLLDAKLGALQEQGAHLDVSMQQTCREMIHSRQQLFLRLSR